MKKARIRVLLWVFFLFISGQGASESEVRYVLSEGKTLCVQCPTSSWKYHNSRKAWQRLDGAEPLTLAITERPGGRPTQIQVGRYILEDIPHDSILKVQVTDLREADSGLYRCVIYQPPKDPEVLFHPIRLVVTKGIPDANEFTTLLHTINTQSKPQTTSGAITQISFISTASVNLTDVTDVTRISVTNIVILVACGLLSKSLVFSVLLAVTQRSFAR